VRWRDFFEEDEGGWPGTPLAVVVPVGAP